MKKKLVLACTLIMLTNVKGAFADTAADAETILNWAETTYPEFLTNHEVTKTYQQWLFRYYAKTDLYIGINTQDNRVYSLFGSPNAAVVNLGSVDGFLQQATASAVAPTVNEPVVDVPVTVAEPAPACDQSYTPAGLSYAQNGNAMRVTTNGQCVAFPMVDMCLPTTPVAGGLSVLKRMNIQSYELKGISFAIPSVAQTLDPQIKNAANIKTCVKNAPQNFAAMGVSVDGCFDVTDRVKDFPSIKGLITVTPPVGIQLQGDINTEVVADCFSTDALIVTDAVTHEIWDNKNGRFIKR